MTMPEPADFLLHRAASVARRAKELHEQNATRRTHAARAVRRAQIAMVRAHLFAQYAADLTRQSSALQARRPRVQMDDATRARLREDELLSRRIARRLRQRRSG
ncbi:MAG TPA: hypothetical protein VH916_04265 [Dehalococcoidia bacterium]